MLGPNTELEDHFSLGDRYGFATFDTDNPAISGIGTITAVTLGTIVIDFEAVGEIPATLGTDEFMLCMPSFALMTGSLSASVSQSVYGITDSGSLNAGAGLSEQSSAAGIHFFHFTP
jgi:hypothetical protein